MGEIVERLKLFGSKVRDIAKRFFRYENATLAVILVAIVVAFGVMTNGLTVTRANISNVWLQSATPH